MTCEFLSMKTAGHIILTSWQDNPMCCIQIIYDMSNICELKKPNFILPLKHFLTLIY